MIEVIVLIAVVCWVSQCCDFSDEDTTPLPNPHRNNIADEVEECAQYARDLQVYFNTQVAQVLYAQHKDKSNKEIIEIFMAELDMSKAGATTYLYNCKKAAK